MPRKHSAPATARFRLRLSVGDTIAVGPGKIALLQAIDEQHSLNAAAKSLGMSYKRAWDLISELNSSLRKPAVTSIKGGASGGGTLLTETGLQLVKLYRSIEDRAAEACKTELDQIKAMLCRP